MFKKKHSGVKLESFIGGLVYGVTQAQQGLVKSRFDKINRHFVKNDEGRYVPKNLCFEPAENVHMNIASYLFSHVNDLGLEKVTIRGSAKIVDMEEVESESEHTDHDSQSVFYVRHCKPGDESFEIEIELSKKETYEPQQRLIEVLNHQIEPHTPPPKDPGGEEGTS